MDLAEGSVIKYLMDPRFSKFLKNGSLSGSVDHGSIRGNIGVLMVTHKSMPFTMVQAWV